MSKMTVKYSLDPADVPPLTPSQKKELKKLAVMPDDHINMGDIPPLTDQFWKNAVRNPFYKPIKQSTTVRVDQDVLLWLKSKGRGYQTRINHILRNAMLGELTAHR